jgi:bacillithiol biosynthesis cysteine-adding enzyme BshC
MLWKALREYGSVPADPSATAAPGAATRLAVDIRRFSWVRPLAGEYAFNFGNVAPLYAGDPQSDDAWRDAAARVQRRPRNVSGAAACIAAQQQRRGAPDRARAAAGRLTDPRALAVVTGQQAGAFGGPLFTLLKAITAIQLARRAEAMLGCPAIAAFWVDAEDHDWNEVSGCTVLDSDLRPHAITLTAPEGAGEVPVASLQLDGRVSASIDELEAVLARTDFTAWAVESVRAAYRAGESMSDAFGRWLESLLGPHGLVVFDAADSAVKPFLAGVFSRELARPGQTSALAVEAGEALAACGHSPQVMPQPDSVALFRLNGTRQPIRRHGDQFVIGDRVHDAGSLAEEAASHPERFSPNVLLRPIAQDTLFPTICYVAGPSELAYLGQLRRIYEHFDVPMPLVYPRATATVVDSATARFLTKYDVPFEDLQRQDESALNRLLEAQLPPSVEAAMKAADDTIRGALQQVIDVMPGIDPTLSGAAKTTLGRIERELRALHGKLIQAAKKRDETLRRQFTRAQAQTFPQGQPQERVLAGVHFLNLYGPAFIDRLIQELPLDFGTHWVMSI